MLVFKSSLLQVPPAQQTIGPERVVDILVANSKYIGERHMSAVGIRPVSNYVIASPIKERQAKRSLRISLGLLRSPKIRFGERSQRPIKLACPNFCPTAPCDGFLKAKNYSTRMMPKCE